MEEAVTGQGLAAQAGISWTPAQMQALEVFEAQEAPQRLCLYYPTGAGKTLTALACIASAGHRLALVVAPPSTHGHWQAEAARLGLVVAVVSHAKFRQPGFKLDREVPVIADEFHLFGGVGKVGMKKLSRLSGGLKAPLILCSATPNYNDAERCYNVQHVLAPETCRGGILSFLYEHCLTEENPFSITPLVTGFKHHGSAAEYLSSLPNVVYLPDPSQLGIVDIEFTPPLNELLEEYGMDSRKGRLVASLMEKRHARNYFNKLNSAGMVRAVLYHKLTDIAGESTTPIMVFCNSSKILLGVVDRLQAEHVPFSLVTGSTSTHTKAVELEKFLTGKTDVLCGTAALATGTDGIDKVCDTLVILDDTDDDSLRRQLVGRILPRGLDTDESGKKVYRFVHH